MYENRRWTNGFGVESGVEVSAGGNFDQVVRYGCHCQGNTNEHQAEYLPLGVIRVR
jgi:hypothetical protein